MPLVVIHMAVEMHTRNVGYLLINLNSPSSQTVFQKLFPTGQLASRKEVLSYSCLKQDLMLKLRTGLFTTSGRSPALQHVLCLLHLSAGW